MRLTILASGSSGNALVVEAGRSRILLDCGISLRRLCRHLAERSLSLEDLDAVLLTHEHHDHVQGLGALSRRQPVPLLATAGTVSALGSNGSRFEIVVSGRPRTVGELEVMPVATSHDAREPVAFVLQHRGLRVGVVTDTGAVTGQLAECLTGCHALLVETNHDLDMLRLGPYPWHLKQRIASRAGHLSNEQARDLVDRIAHGCLETVVGMHLSEENNRPELAAAELAAPLAGSNARVAVAPRASVLEVVVGGQG